MSRIAARFKASDYSISGALNDLLMLDAFWAPVNWGSLVKSPVDLVVGTVRQFNFSYTDATPFVLKAAQLGQNLLVPPNVKGWPGQNAWINATTLLERKRFTEQLFRAVELKSVSKTLPMAMPAGGVRQMTRLLGRDGIFRVAEDVARITFDPASWLAAYGAYTDFEPTEDVKTRLAQTLLPVPPTQTIAHGTVGVAYLRNLTLDPAYQLK